MGSNFWSSSGLQGVEAISLLGLQKLDVDKIESGNHQLSTTMSIPCFVQNISAIAAANHRIKLQQYSCSRTC